MQCLLTSIAQRAYHRIDDFVYLPREVYGLDESTKRAALAVFQEMDGDGSGGVDQREMYQLVQVLFQRLGPVCCD